MDTVILNLTSHQIGVLLRCIQLERNNLMSRTHRDGNIVAMINELDHLQVLIQSQTCEQAEKQARGSATKTNILEFKP